MVDQIMLPPRYNAGTNRMMNVTPMPMFWLFVL